MTLLEGRSLRKTYTGDGVVTTALHGIDIAVDRGEFISIMGPSGCGKSTLMNLLGALDVPTDGDVLFDGKSLRSLSEKQLTTIRRQHIGFVFQFFNLVPVLTLEENVAFPAVMDGRHDYHDQMADVLKALHLEQHRRKLPSQLSGGEQQRAAIARALINTPDLVLLDEPTGNLDTASAGELMSYLRDVHESGQTILLVTHDPTVASRGKRILYMRDGEIVEEVDLPRKADRTAAIGRLLRFEANEAPSR
jgi:putative ABC transport system ATP-binding protein